MIQELFNLAAPFTDEGDDADVGAGEAGHHAQESAFAHAAAGKNSHPLPPAQSEEAIDGTDTHVQGFSDLLPADGIQGPGIERVGEGGVEGALVVQRSPEAIQHPAQESFAHLNHGLPVLEHHPSLGPNTPHLSLGHEQDLTLPEPHYLSSDGAFWRRHLNLTDSAHRGLRPPAGDDQAHHFLDPSGEGIRGRLTQGCVEMLPINLRW
jgi:hypothetical protein